MGHTTPVLHAHGFPRFLPSKNRPTRSSDEPRTDERYRQPHTNCKTSNRRIRNWVSTIEQSKEKIIASGPPHTAVDVSKRPHLGVGVSKGTHLDVAEGPQDVHLLIRYDYSCPGGVLDGVSRLTPLPGNAPDRTATSSATQKIQKREQADRQASTTIIRIVCLHFLPRLYMYSQLGRKTADVQQCKLTLRQEDKRHSS